MKLLYVTLIVSVILCYAAHTQRGSYNKVDPSEYGGDGSHYNAHYRGGDRNKYELIWKLLKYGAEYVLRDLEHDGEIRHASDYELGKIYGIYKKQVDQYWYYKF